MAKNVGQLNVKLTADTKPLEQGVDTAVDKLKEAQSEVQKTDTTSLDNLKNTVSSVFTSLKGIASQVKAEWDAARAPVESVNNDVQGVASSIQLMRMPLDEFASRLNELNQEQLQGLFDKVTNEITESKIGASQLKKELSQMTKSRVNAGEIEQLKAAIKETAVDTQVLRTRLSLIKSALKSVKIDNMKELSDNVKDIGDKAKDAGVNISSSFKKGFSSLKRFAFALIGIRQGFSYLIQSMKTYISSSDELTAKTTGISQALAQSLAPYTEIAVSALQKLVNWVILAVAYFTTFINKIFGTNIAIAGAASSMKDLTKNTKKAAAESKKALAPFDELNILQEGNDTQAETAYIAPDFSGLGISEDQFAGLESFGQWLTDNKETIQWLLITIGAIVAVWTLWNVAVGIFNALMAVNPIVLIITAAIAVIALIIIYWDELSAAALTVLEAIGAAFKWLFDTIIMPIIETFIAVFQALFDFIKGIIDTVVSIFSTAFNLIKDTVLLVINIIIGYWKMWYENVKVVIDAVWNIITTIFGGIKDFISKILQGDIAGAFEGLKNTIINVFNIVWNTIKKIFSNIWDFISGVAGGIADTFSSAIKGTVNAIIGFAEKVINGFIKAINLAIDIINAIPGVDIKKIALLDIPRLASGGVATSPSVVEIGEYSGAKSNPEIVSPRDMMYDTMLNALRDSQYSGRNKQEVEMTINVKYEDGKTIIKKINTAQDEAGRTLLEV